MSSANGDPTRAVVRAAVVTVSDRCSAGQSEDLSGALLVSRLLTLPAAIVERRCIADDADAVVTAVTECSALADIVALTGGTGLAARDITPQAVSPLLDYEVPGMAEVMRARGAATTVHAMLSRQLVGVRGRCLVLVLPGSPRAVADCLDAVWAALPHALKLLRGGSGEHAPAG